MYHVETLICSMCMTVMLLFLLLLLLLLLLCRDDGEGNVFSFVMPSLMEYLEKMKQKDSQKSYYNIQILKYEVSLAQLRACSL